MSQSQDPTVYILNEQNSVVNNFLAEIRDEVLQKDAAKFRANLTKCGSLLAYELSKSLDYSSRKVNTPLTSTSLKVTQDEIVLGCILRASLPFYNGFLEMFDQAESGFVGAGRKATQGNEFDIALDYLGFPNLTNKTLVLIDPMLATGKSLLKTLELLLVDQKPKKLLIASLIATPEAVELLKSKLKVDFDLFTVAMDSGLNDHYYIVPGLGDAGDLAFGPKEIEKKN